MRFAQGISVSTCNSPGVVAEQDQKDNDNNAEGQWVSLLIHSLFAPFPVGVDKEGDAASDEHARRSSLLLVRSSSDG